MTNCKYPISLSGHVFYWENNHYYEVFEDDRREEMTREAFDHRSAELNAVGTRFLIFDDKQIALLLQVWSQAPQKIDIERLEFYRDFGMITLEQYSHYYQLRTKSLA